ncbi:MAG: Hsp70 family protein [Bryobacteraceae bacterium]
MSFLRSKDNIRLIQSVRAQASEPDKLDRLMEIVDNDLGYQLHRSVQKTKVDLSADEEAVFCFRDASVEIERSVKRSQFEKWIAKDLAQIANCVEGLLARSNVEGGQIDRVFLTGGSSLIPAVKRIFEERFGGEKLAGGDEFTSVAKGLALRALREEL